MTKATSRTLLSAALILIAYSSVTFGFGVPFAFFPKIGVGVTPVNVALSTNGGVAAASSTYIGGGYNESNVINGDRLGVGWSAGGGWNDYTLGTFPDWIQVTFNAAYTINRIDVFTLQDSYASPSTPTLAMTFATYGITDFQVQYWDGAAWVTVSGGNVTANNNVWRQFTFSPVSTTKIRILISASAGANDYSRVTEVEAWTAP
jgi:hypothetical protein